ncbi:hypothetical protein GGF46_002737 [Coemansia sp. RSA 552]|nr:hypothetical protein GGF46_002737 [Coemansia sp. RSA 552]
MAVPVHRRPYDLQSPAPTSRTFWNHYETGLLVQLWLEFEPQFLANKRNAGVWAQLAQRLTERSGRQRTVRECRIKWKNMWAKHRDLANASHMGLDAKLREFPHFTEFAAIRQRGSQHQQLQLHASANERSEGKRTPLGDDRHAVGSSGPPAPLASHSARYSPGSEGAAVPHHGGGLALQQLLTMPRAPADAARPEPPRRQEHASPMGSARTASPAGFMHVATSSPDPGPSQQGLTLYDLPQMLHRLDCAVDYGSARSEDQFAGPSTRSIVEQMRALASASSSADVSGAAQQIVGYIERESRRRHQQSERHHAVVAALADILAQLGAAPAAAPSAATSRRSSEAIREWSPAQSRNSAPSAAPDRLALILHAEDESASTRPASPTPHRHRSTADPADSANS